MRVDDALDDPAAAVGEGGLAAGLAAQPNVVLPRPTAKAPRSHSRRPKRRVRDSPKLLEIERETALTELMYRSYNARQPARERYGGAGTSVAL
jgi:hypothetical protein